MFVWGTGVSHVVFVALLFILACGMKHANTTHKLENWSKLRGKLMIKIEKFWRAGLKKFDICLRTHTKHIQGLSHPSVEDRACSFEVAALLCFPSEAARFATQNSCTLHTHEASLCHPGRHLWGYLHLYTKSDGHLTFPFLHSRIQSMPCNCELFAQSKMAPIRSPATSAPHQHFDVFACTASLERTKTCRVGKGHRRRSLCIPNFTREI